MKRPNRWPAPRLRERNKCTRLFFGAVLMMASCLPGQNATTQPIDDPEARPSVSKADIQIVKRARQILNSSAKWNRADTRDCPPAATTFSLYCALEKATDEVSANFAHRGAAMQEARFVIDVIRPNANYEHRLMDFNNDPKTSFDDIQKVFDLLELDITARLAWETLQPPSTAPSAVAPNGSNGDSPLTQADIQVVERAIAILDAPSKWNRAEKQNVPPEGVPIGLYGAMEKADREVTGTFDDHCPAMREARRLIDQTAPNHQKYKARLVDYNNDPTTSFSDIQKLLRTVEQRLKDRLAAESKR